MSVLLETANTERLTRTASTFNQNADYTWSAWVYFTTIVSGGALLAAGADASVANLDLVTVQGSNIRVQAFDSAGVSIGFNDGATALATGTWYYVTLRRSGSTLGVYLNGVLEISITAAVTGRSQATRMNIGFRETAGASADIRTAYSRIHTSALTTGEISSERTAASAVLTTGLWSDAKLTVHTDLTDSSGNGRDWSASGTLSTADDPPDVVVPTVAGTNACRRVTTQPVQVQ